MSTVLLEEDSPAEVAVQQKRSTHSPANRKTLMTYEEALIVLHDYNGQLKTAGKTRISKSGGAAYDLEFHTFIKTALIALASSGTASIGTVFGLAPEMALTPLAVSGLVIGVAGFLGIVPPRFMAALSPIKAKKIAAERGVREALYEIKEKDFAKVEAKLLKKAEKAITVINKELKNQGKEIVYNPERDSYWNGFQVRTHYVDRHSNEIISRARETSLEEAKAITRNERKELAI